MGPPPGKIGNTPIIPKTLAQSGSIFQYLINTTRAQIHIIKDANNMNKKRYTFIAHRIVANTFIPNIYNKKEVNHINGIKDDNRVENLEWCSPSENIQKALLFNPNFGKNRGKNNKRLTEEDVIEIKKMMIGIK